MGHDIPFSLFAPACMCFSGIESDWGRNGLGCDHAQECKFFKAMGWSRRLCKCIVSRQFKCFNTDRGLNEHFFDLSSKIEDLLFPRNPGPSVRLCLLGKSWLSSKTRALGGNTNLFPLKLEFNIHSYTHSDHFYSASSYIICCCLVTYVCAKIFTLPTSWTLHGLIEFIPTDYYGMPGPRVGLQAQNNYAHV